MLHKTVFYALLLLPCISCRAVSETYELQRYLNDSSVKRLQEYIQIDTSRLENMELVVDFWRHQAKELGLPFKVYRPGGLPVCVTTLIGRKPDLPSILLNSHADVVPVDAILWTYPPFAAHIDENGDMYGRGTQDTKGVGMQYMEAIRKLLQNRVSLDRTVHVMVVPDEETGSYIGLKPFTETHEFKSLNIGFALDEGLTSEDDTMYAVYRDKRPWQMRFNIRGVSGHGSALKRGSALEQVRTLLDLAMEYRDRQLAIMESVSPLDYGAYSSLNINVIKGGLAANVVPSFMTMIVDVRLAVEEKVPEFESMINSWMARLSNASTVEFLRRDEYSATTAVDDTNPYWIAMRTTLKNLGLKVKTIDCPATSDMIVLRGMGIPAIGFSSRTNMINRLHDVDEYISVDNFLRGIDIYVALITSLANLPEKGINSNIDSNNYDQGSYGIKIISLTQN